MTAFAPTTNVRTLPSFLQRLRMLLRFESAVEEPIVAEPEKPADVMHNMKYTHSTAFDYAQLGGQS